MKPTSESQDLSGKLEQLFADMESEVRVVIGEISHRRHTSWEDWKDLQKVVLRHIVSAWTIVLNERPDTSWIHADDVPTEEREQVLNWIHSIAASYANLGEVHLFLAGLAFAYSEVPTKGAKVRLWSQLSRHLRNTVLSSLSETDHVADMLRTRQSLRHYRQRILTESSPEHREATSELAAQLVSHLMSMAAGGAYEDEIEWLAIIQSAVEDTRDRVLRMFQAERYRNQRGKLFFLLTSQTLPEDMMDTLDDLTELCVLTCENAIEDIFVAEDTNMGDFTELLWLTAMEYIIDTEALYLMHIERMDNAQTS